MNLVGCATSLPRTKWNDAQHRVFIDPENINTADYARIQHALVNTGKFVVVDRAQALRAVKKEQERLHREESDRFEDKEKFAWYGKLYGVGSIIVANVQCKREASFWNNQNQVKVCLQRLAVIHANTGQIMASVENTNSEAYTFDLEYIAPDWEGTVEKLVDNFPKNFEVRGPDKELEIYKDVSKEEAQRQREIASKKVE